MTDKITPDEVSELVDRYKQWNIGSDKDGQVLPKARFQDAHRRPARGCTRRWPGRGR